MKILSEIKVLDLLNITIETLDTLRREQGFPYVKLTRRDRVYFLEDILEWLENRKGNTEDEN